MGRCSPGLVVSFADCFYGTKKHRHELMDFCTFQHLVVIVVTVIFVLGIVVNVIVVIIIVDIVNDVVVVVIVVVVVVFHVNKSESGLLFLMFCLCRVCMLHEAKTTTRLGAHTHTLLTPFFASVLRSIGVTGWISQGPEQKANR